MKVFLREKKLSKGRRSLYLDFYPPIPHPEMRKPTRREHLKLYIYEKPKTETEKDHNKETKILGETLCARRQLEIQSGYYGFLTAHNSKKNFIAFFEDFSESKRETTSKSNYENYVSIGNYVKAFAGETCTFANVDEHFCRSFKYFLLKQERLSGNTASSYFDKFKYFIREAYKQKMLKENPAEGIKSIKTVAPNREFLSFEELQSLAETPFHYEDMCRAYLRILFERLAAVAYTLSLKESIVELIHFFTILQFCAIQFCAMLFDMENPFEFGRELGSDELVNRVEELALVKQTINSGGKLFVIGPRRYGKTSLLKASAENSAKEGNMILRYNAEAFAEINGLVKKIIEDSARLLKGSVEKTGEQIKRYFKSLRPEISFSVTQSEWKSSIGVTSTANAGNISLLVDALNGLEELASEQKEKKTALIIDEFQEILSSEGITAEKQIRSAIQTHKNTAYIFAGSKTRMLTEMTTEASRPFYRFGTMLFIGELPRTEFSRFLLDRFTFSGFFSAKNDEKEKRDLTLKILDLAEDVPYNVQMLAHSLWNCFLQIKIAAPEGAYLTADLIDETLEKIIRQSDPFYTQIWNGLTTIQKKTLTAVVEEDGQNLQSNRVTTRSGVSPSSIRRSLESLISQDVLRQEEKRGNIKIRFEDPFFAHWIKLFSNS